MSIPIIALSSGFGPLFFGRLLQGVSGGLIGVVVPLYLAECLRASNRGKGTAIFQWLLTFGIVAAALVGMYFSYQVAAVEKLGDAAALFHFKDHAWRAIFWVSLPPGVLFVLGSLLVTESPRWLFRRGAKDKAQKALLRSRSQEDAALEMEEMNAVEQSASKKLNQKIGDSLLQRKYVIPFLLACVILACNTATGVNSMIGYNVSILMQSGLSDLSAHWGYVIFTAMNFTMTAVGMTLVDRKGRKFLFILGTSGIIVALVTVGTLFLRTEKVSVDARDAGAANGWAGTGFDTALRPGCSCKAACGYGQYGGERGRLGRIALRSRLFIRTATLPRRRRLCARMMRPPHPSPSRGRRRFLPIESSRCLPIRLPTSTLRRPRRW